VGVILSGSEGSAAHQQCVRRPGGTRTSLRSCWILRLRSGWHQTGRN